MLHVGEAVESWPMGRDRCTLCIYFRKRLCWGLESSDTYCLGGGASAVASHTTSACSKASPLRPGRDIVWVSPGCKFTPDVVRDLQTLSVPLQAIVKLRLGCAFLRPCHRLSDACALATSLAHETATAMDYFAVAAANDLFSVDDCPLLHIDAEDLFAGMCVFGAAEVLPQWYTSW